MVFLRRSTAAILTIIFIALFLLVVVGLSFDQTLLDAGYIKEQFRKNGVYTFALEEAVPQTIRHNSQFLQGLPLDSEDVIFIVQRTISAEWLQEQVEQTLDQAIPYMKGDRDDVTISISLREQKSLFAESLTDVLFRKYEELPECQPGEGLTFDGFPNCRLFDIPFLQVAVKIGEIGIEAGVDQLVEDELTLSNQDFEEELSQVNDIRSTAETTILLLYVGIAALAALLLLIGLIGGQRLTAKIQWVGATISLSSLLLLVLAFVVKSLSSGAFTTIFEEQKEIPEVVATGIGNIIESIANDVITRIQIEMGVLMAIGIVILVAPTLYRLRRKQR